MFQLPGLVRESSIMNYQLTYVFALFVSENQDEMLKYIVLLIKLQQIITLHITGALNVVLFNEQQCEMYRYLYNHQVIMTNTKLLRSSIRTIGKEKKKKLLVYIGQILFSRMKTEDVYIYIF